jgi:hypothetical protein
VKPIERTLATIRAALAPIAIYALARYEAPAHPGLWLLVVAGGVFFLPIVAKWAQIWRGGPVRGWSCSVLIVLIVLWPQTPLWLAVAGVALTAAVCAMWTWRTAGEAGAP